MAVLRATRAPARPAAGAQPPRTRQHRGPPLAVSQAQAAARGTVRVWSTHAQGAPGAGEGTGRPSNPTASGWAPTHHSP